MPRKHPIFASAKAFLILERTQNWVFSLIKPFTPGSTITIPAENRWLMEEWMELWLNNATGEAAWYTKEELTAREITADDILILSMLYLPGHTPGHSGFLYHPTKSFLCGDLFINIRRSWLSSEPSHTGPNALSTGHWDDVFESMQKVIDESSIKTIYLAHDGKSGISLDEASEILTNCRNTSTLLRWEYLSLTPLIFNYKSVYDEI